jgi:tRNA pseudouridine55 synthase
MERTDCLGHRPERLNGWLVLDKPARLGSTAAVSAVKRALREAGEPRSKVGHGGTLDPLASGVLPIAIGEATKLCGRLLDATKAYDFTVALGCETDTLDREGAVVARSDARPVLEQLETLLPQFTGSIAQVPPAYSALKVRGRPAYARARAGETVELASRMVTIHRLALVEAEASEGGIDRIRLHAEVSKGTYVRSLARDIARALGTFGHVTDLRRTRAGPFDLTQAVTLDFLAKSAKARALTRVALPLEAALDDIPALPVTPGQAQLLRNGQRLAGFPALPGLQLATDGQRPVALVEATVDGLRVVRGFNL